LTDSTEQLHILFQDEHIVAIHKPAGLLVHKSPIDRHETRYAMKILRNQLGQWVYPVHRLDKPTSGLLLFALDAEIATQLSGQFEQRQVYKRYQAIVRGHAFTRHIDHPLKDIAAFKHQQSEADEKAAKEAITELKPARYFELPFPDGRFATSRYTLVDLYPKTGRKHQLRRHMKHISHPIVGDVKYGKGTHNRLFREQFHCPRLLLAATELELTHPVTADTLTLQCPLAEDFASLLNTLETYHVHVQAPSPDAETGQS